MGYLLYPNFSQSPQIIGRYIVQGLEQHYEPVYVMFLEMARTRHEHWLTKFVKLWLKAP